MNGSGRIGGAPLLAAICIGVIAVVKCAGEPSIEEDQPKIAASYLKNNGAVGAPEQRVALDFSRPVHTRRRAIICSQDILLEAAMSRAAEGPMERVLDAFYSGFDQSAKVKAAGCEEWKAGVRLYNVQPMKTLTGFIAFGISPTGMADYFTMEPHLANTSSAEAP